MRFVWLGLLLSTAALDARAEGDVFAVIPTESFGDVALRAKHISEMMHLALAERSLKVAPQMSAAEVLTGDHAMVCASSHRACAESIGTATGASKVIWSALFDVSAGGPTAYSLSLELFDLRSKTSTPSSKRSGDIGELVTWAQQQVLGYAGIETVGGLTILDMPVGTEILTDGIAKTRTPMVSAIKLPPGRHEVELRYADASPWRGFVEIKANETVSLRRCVEGNAVVECTNAAPTPSPDPLFIGGVASLGAGVVGLAVGGVFSAVSGAAAQDYSQTGPADLTQAQVDGALLSRNIALASVVVGAGATIAGAGVVAASMFLE